MTKSKKNVKGGGKNPYQQFVLEPWEEDHLRGKKRKGHPVRVNSLQMNQIERAAEGENGLEEEDEIAELQEIDKMK